MYIGLSGELADNIARDANGKRANEFDLRKIDEKVVNPQFLDKNLPQLERIVLTATPQGYSVEAFPKAE